MTARTWARCHGGPGVGSRQGRRRGHRQDNPKVEGLILDKTAASARPPNCAQQHTSELIEHWSADAEERPAEKNSKTVFVTGSTPQQGRAERRRAPIFAGVGQP